MGGIEGPGKETKPEAVSANRKLELWGYNANLVLRDGENIVCAFLRLVADGTLTASEGHGLTQRESFVHTRWQVLAEVQEEVQTESVDGAFRAVV